MSGDVELPTIPGLYVAHTAISGEDNPAGAVIWVLDEEDHEWYEHDVWNSEGYVEPTYPEGLQHYANRNGWRMLRLVVEK